MDFDFLKKKAQALSDAVGEKFDGAVSYGAKKIQEGKYTIKDKTSFDALITASKTTSYTNKETNETKEYKHKSVVIIGKKGDDFFKRSLINFPVLATKAYSQNIMIRLAESEIPGVDLEKYEISEFPCILVFQEEKIYKTIFGKDNILKLVKSLSLDINKEIENL